MNLKTLLDYSLIAQATDQELKLLVRLKAPEATACNRKPLNLGVVVDRSGSMHGEKMENTRLALKTLITHLGPDDRLSIVQFDEAVQVLLEPTQTKDKDALKRLVDRIHTGGATNLSGGWLQSLDLLQREATPDRISRCLLLTDGQANAGIQDPAKLVRIGSEARRNFGISTTTLGFGGDFDENLLSGIAKGSGGGFYYLDKAEQAPGIFKEELQGLLEVVAQNIAVHLSLRPPVQFLVQWTAHPAVAGPSGTHFDLGDAYAGEEKNLLLSLLIPGMSALGPAVLADVEVSCMEITEAGVSATTLRQEVRVDIAEPEAAEGLPPEVEVLHQYGFQFAAKAREQAIEEADRGDFGKARETLRHAAETISEIPEPTDLLQEEISALHEHNRLLDRRHYTDSRKMMRETSHSLSTADYRRVREARERRSKRRSGTEPDSAPTK